ncbi:MAG: hypothetical protein AAGE86_02295 [Pseudomonadota bacterium]
MAITKLSERTVLEIAEHEGLVLETYVDSVGVETWSFGITDASGHKVDRYRDNPSTVERAIEVYEWLLRTKYLPDVLRAFEGVKLNEHQLAGALSFHWNTGAILRASWVKSFVAGKRGKAFREFMNWSKPREIIGRRKAERALFFNDVWTSDGHVTLWQRVHSNGTPDWSSGKQIDIRDALRAALAKGDPA